MHVAVAGGNVYFGSSAADKFTCLDAATGEVRWTFYTEGPVRLAPTVAAGKVYFGSDDGHAYCLAADDGRLLWKYRPGPTDRRIPGNGRMISQWPLRCGVLVDGDTAFLCAGLFPNYGVYFCVLDAATGTERHKSKLTGLSPQGYMMASDTRLYVPSGRTSPAVFDRSTGKPLSIFHPNSRSGSYALLGDDVLVARGQAEGSLGISDLKTRQRLVLFRGSHMVARGERAFVQTPDELAALDRTEFLDLARRRIEATGQKAEVEKQIRVLRQLRDVAGAQAAAAELGEIDKQIKKLAADAEACWMWRKPCMHALSLILAGNVLLAGGDGQIAAYRLEDGEIAWQAAVQGKAYGLAIAAGRLFVSTDEGAIHCFQ